MALSLKNKFSIIILFVFFSFFLFDCTEKKEGKISFQDTTNCAKPLNPNGDSELALLMREMMKSSESLKDAINKGNLPKEFPEAFLKIHSAKPTDSETKKESFNVFADNYIDNLKILYGSNKSNIIQNYNAVVSACISCHTEHCPGPIKAIVKLKME